MRLNNKNIVVTGGASGIGLAAVERFLREGANVVMADLPSTSGEKRAAELDEWAFDEPPYQRGDADGHDKDGGHVA